MKKQEALPEIKVVDKDNPSHYVDNKRFYAEIKAYREEYDRAKAEGREAPRINNYLGECVLKIATGLAMKHNFRNYSYIDLMIGAGVETCIKNLHVFDPEKSENPFSYFTQACYYAFIHVITKEKKESLLKKKLILSSAIDTYDLQAHDEDGEFAIPLMEYINSITSEDIKEMQPKKKPKKSTSLDALFEDKTDE